MKETRYLTWLAGTSSHWNNDSAVMDQVERAVAQGAIGVTTNPPLSHEALVTDTHLYKEKLAALDHALPDDAFALEAMGLVVEHFSQYFAPMHQQRGTYFGCVRAQVAPNLRGDAAGMLTAGKRLAEIGGNVMVKIPGTRAGIQTLEELAALGIPTNPTVITTVAQAIASAEAFDRGRRRAVEAGIEPAWSTCAVVMGRTQDYLAGLNRDRNGGVSDTDLAWAALAIVKRCYRIFRERGYHTLLMPAAFRSPLQVAELAGGEFHATIHPKVQKAVEEAADAGEMTAKSRIDAPVDEAAVARVQKALPEFSEAYEPGGLTPEQFDTYGAVTMTLDGFEAGWKKLVSLKKSQPY